MPGRGAHQSPMMEEHRPSEGAEPRAFECAVDEHVGRAQVERRAHRVLPRECRIDAAERHVDRGTPVEEVARDREPAARPERSAVWMPPAVSGDTRPAASPTSTTSRVAKGRTVPPIGISPPRVPIRRARSKSKTRATRAMKRSRFGRAGSRLASPTCVRPTPGTTHPMYPGASCESRNTWSRSSTPSTSSNSASTPARNARLRPRPAPRATPDRGPSAPTRMRPDRPAGDAAPQRSSAPASDARSASERNSAGVSVARK